MKMPAVWLRGWCRGITTSVPWGRSRQLVHHSAPWNPSRNTWLQVRPLHEHTACQLASSAMTMGERCQGLAQTTGPEAQSHPPGETPISTLGSGHPSGIGYSLWVKSWLEWVAGGDLVFGVQGLAFIINGTLGNDFIFLGLHFPV